MAKQLSSSTLAVWQFLARFSDEHGYPPSLREFAAGCYMSMAMVQRHLDRLDERGVIELHHGARAIKLVERPPH